MSFFLGLIEHFDLFFKFLHFFYGLSRFYSFFEVTDLLINDVFLLLLFSFLSMNLLLSE